VSIVRKHTSRRMSEIVIHGDTIYLAGQVGETSQGIAAQTAETLAHIDRLLIEAGSSREHILQVIIWLKDIADFDGMNSVYDAWVPEGYAPVRATSETKLADSSLLVEIIVTAALKN
jgi:enamine deaminase RidA (YjgF/YER057c/UK114 family)